MPVCAFICRAKDCAVGSAGPGDSSAYVVDAAQAGRGVGVLKIPLGVSGEGEDWKAEKSEDVLTHVPSSLAS